LSWLNCRGRLRWWNSRFRAFAKGRNRSMVFVWFVRNGFLGRVKGLLDNVNFVSVLGVRILAVLCGSAIMGERWGSGFVGL